MFTKIVHVLESSKLWVPITSSSFVCLHLLVSEVANVFEAVLQELYCLLQCLHACNINTLVNTFHSLRNWKV